MKNRQKGIYIRLFTPFFRFFPNFWGSWRIRSHGGSLRPEPATRHTVRSSMDLRGSHNPHLNRNENSKINNVEYIKSVTERTACLYADVRCCSPRNQEKVGFQKKGGGPFCPFFFEFLHGKPRDMQKCVKNALWSPFETAFSDSPPDHIFFCAKIDLSDPPNP